MKDNLASKKQRTDIFTEDELTRLLNPELYTDKALYLYYAASPERCGRGRRGDCG